MEGYRERNGFHLNVLSCPHLDGGGTIRTKPTRAQNMPHFMMCCRFMTPYVSVIPVFSDHCAHHAKDPDFMVVEYDGLHPGISWLKADMVRFDIKFL